MSKDEVNKELIAATGLIYTEIFGLLLEYSERHTYGGIVTFDPELIAPTVSTMAMTARSTLKHLEDHRYGSAYKELLEVSALAVYNLLTLRAGFTPQILDELENDGA